MTKIRIARIRPVSWKVHVQEHGNAEAVRGLLFQAGVHTTNPQQEPGLLDPPIFSFVATPDAESSMTSVELEELLLRDQRIELEFEKAGP